MQKEGYMTLTKAAEYAGISRSTMYRWYKERGLSTHKKKGLRLVSIADLERFIEEGADNYRRPRRKQ